ncbi:DEAD/DEAH box helicase [Roseateles violae]|uniref:DEAD/DEAH box helicase n=1 Tax=Roseateles violae TaxID=3058042 RepID=A0ABT8DQ79_9BURK|nr:DEAD/DEAH box helicase [Pelomonas sp. PFR6]MDN3920153.1 DEAD/DEAH box helicase [Pelomonas sp. PFR6]
MSFENLGLHEGLLKAVKDAGYENATDIQAQAIPAALKGEDLMGSSRTGSGKTAAFILPALQKILDNRAADAARPRGKNYGPRVLVLAPTRELAQQVAKAAQTYGRNVPGLRICTVLGGMPYPLQIRQLTGPVDIVIATPGRLMDHIQSGKCVLDNVQTLVLDEADRMLDMGFIDDIKFIADRIPAERQTVMFSATFAGHVGRLAQDLLRNPTRVDVSGHTDTHENITQRLHWADNNNHRDQLLEAILTESTLDQAVVFTSTQRDADWLAERLQEIGHAVAPLHGGMPQGRRNRVLMALRRREVRVLVATDVAARGIDVPTITHVINYGLPMKAEDYVHRIGRTGRAGREGLAVTLACRDDVSMIRRIQQFTTQQIPVARIEGLEPKTQEPRIFPPRPAGSFDDRGPRPGGGGGWGGKPGWGGDRNSRFGGGHAKQGFHRDAGKPFVREGGGGRPEFGGQQRGGEFAPHGEFAPRGPRADFRGGYEGRPSFDRKPGGFQPEPQQQRGFAPRGEFAPRQDRPAYGEKPRFEGKPGGFGGDKPRFEGKPSFGGERGPRRNGPPAGTRRSGFGR